MKFLLASEALHRPYTLMKRTSPEITPQIQQKSRAKVRDAAVGMAEQFESLSKQDLVRFLPPISISFILPAIASFLVEIKSSGKSPADLPGHHFHQCVRSLMSLRDIWPIADSACFLVGQMITNTQIGSARTLGQQANQIPSNDVSRDSRESSPANGPATAVHLAVERVIGDVNEAEVLQETEEIPGIAIPIMDMSYSPGNICADPGAWNDPFPWTMAEFGFGDDFNLDDAEMYIDPSIGDFSTGESFDGTMLNHNNGVMLNPPLSHNQSFPQGLTEE